MSANRSISKSRAGKELVLLTAEDEDDQEGQSNDQEAYDLCRFPRNGLTTPRDAQDEQDDARGQEESSYKVNSHKLFPQSSFAAMKLLEAGRLVEEVLRSDGQPHKHEIDVVDPSPAASSEDEPKTCTKSSAASEKTKEEKKSRCQAGSAPSIPMIGAKLTPTRQGTTTIAKPKVLYLLGRNSPTVRP